jgi:hypothetical protein
LDADAFADAVCAVQSSSAPEGDRSGGGASSAFVATVASIVRATLTCGGGHHTSVNVNIKMQLAPTRHPALRWQYACTPLPVNSGKTLNGQKVNCCNSSTRARPSTHSITSKIADVSKTRSRANEPRSTADRSPSNRSPCTSSALWSNGAVG